MYVWNNSFGGGKGGCVYGGGSDCSVNCSEVRLFSPSASYGVFCQGYRLNLDYNYVSCTGGSGVNCPTPTQCISYEQSYFQNKQCFVSTNNRSHHYCGIIIIYPETRYSNTLPIVTK